MRIAALVIGLVLMVFQDLHGQLRVQALGDGTLAVIDDKTYAFTNPAYLPAFSTPITFFMVGRQGGAQRSEQRTEYPFDTGVAISGSRPEDPDQRTDRTARSDWYWTWGGLLNWESRRLRGSRIGFGILVRQRFPAFDQTSRIFTAGRWIREVGGQAYTFDADFWKDSQTRVGRHGSDGAVSVGAGFAWKALCAGLAGTLTTRHSDTRNTAHFINSEDFLLNFDEREDMEAAWRLQAFRIGWAYRISSGGTVEGYMAVEKDREKQRSVATDAPTERTIHRDQRRLVVVRSIQRIDTHTQLVQQLRLGWGDGDVRTASEAPEQRIEEGDLLEIRAGLGLSTQFRPQTFFVGEIQGIWNDETRTTFEATGIKTADVRTDTTELRVNVGIEQHIRKMWAFRIGMISQHFWFRAERSQFDPTIMIPLSIDRAQRRTRQIRFTAGLGYRYRSFLEANYAFNTQGTLIDDSHAVEVTLRF